MGLQSKSKLREPEKYFRSSECESLILGQRNFRVRKKRRLILVHKNFKLGKDGKMILVLILINNDIDIGIAHSNFLYSESRE